MTQLKDQSQVFSTDISTWKPSFNLFKCNASNESLFCYPARFYDVASMKLKYSYTSKHSVTTLFYEHIFKIKMCTWKVSLFNNPKCSKTFVIAFKQTNKEGLKQTQITAAILHLKLCCISWLPLKGQ